MAANVRDRAGGKLIGYGLGILITVALLPCIGVEELFLYVFGALAGLFGIALGVWHLRT